MTAATAVVRSPTSQGRQGTATLDRLSGGRLTLGVVRGQSRWLSAGPIRQAVAGFVATYNTQWLIGRLGHGTPKEVYEGATTTAAA